jgi:hypothetical protein
MVLGRVLLRSLADADVLARVKEDRAGVALKGGYPASPSLDYEHRGSGSGATVHGV